MNKEIIKSEVNTFCNLVVKKLHIPEYQRAYTWTEKNINKMLEDFDEFIDKKQDKYYMGTVVLHKEQKDNKEIYNIIDGQQRITTLILLNYIVNDCKDFVDIEYSNLQSQARIKENYNYLLKNKNLDKYKDIFKNLIFTIVITTDQDKAFLFFDTQNNRGVKPSVSVLLKAYNLRCIYDVKTQINCAKKWEKHEKQKSDIVLGEVRDKIDWLIKIYLWRVRNWRGSGKQSFGNFESFRDDFTKGLRDGKGGYKKYANSTINIKNNKNSIQITQGLDDDYFEFNTRQPLYSGKCFFEFINYYAKLLDKLLGENINNETFKDLQKIFRVGSNYMASFFTMTTLLYYEQFDNDNLEEFVKRLANLLANVRLKQAQVRKETMQKQFIRAENENIKYNIFDFLTGAFDSDEVLDWLVSVKLIKLDDIGIKGKRKKFNTKYKIFLEAGR